MCNFRQTTDLERNCVSCTQFTSYQTEYEDELEPEDYGRCDINVSECVSSEDICNLYECRFSSKLHITNRPIGNSVVRAISQQHPHKDNAGK